MSTPRTRFSFVSLLLFAASFGLCLSSAATQPSEGAEPAGKLRVLLVAGGCCHDYATQTKLLKEGIEERMEAEVTVVFNPAGNTKTVFEIYESDDWAKGYDLVIHDECSAQVTDQPYVNRILKAHLDGVPAVNLHCAMHSYRWGDYRQPVKDGADNAKWYEMIGVQSTAHGPKTPIELTYDDSHPVTAGLKSWTTSAEELYNNVRVFAGTTALIHGKQMVPPSKKVLKRNPDAKPTEAEAVVAWVNEFGPKRTRIFSTSLGHQNETVGDPRYLDLVVRGIKWACHRLPEGKLILSDDFNRDESQEKVDEIGNGWSTNSKTRAGGNKQADLKDGKLKITMHESADHAVSVRHDAEFQDGIIEVAFMLEDKKDKLGLDLADAKLKTVHAGHLFKVTIGANRLEIADFKTGVMDLKMREARQANRLTDEMKKVLATKKKTFPIKLSTGEWHSLKMEMIGDRVLVIIDGQQAGEFSSEGFAHPTKRMLRVAVPREVVLDDLKIYKIK